MKKCIIFIITLTVLLGVFSCAKKQDDTIELKIIIPWINEELDGFLPVIEEFEAANPNIKVKYQIAKAEDVSTLLSTQFGASTTPADVIDIPWAWFIRNQAEKGHVLDVSDAINESDFIKGSFDQVKIDNKLYGVPGVGGITVPEYRKSFFAENNLPNPNGMSAAEFSSLLDQLMAIEGLEYAFASGGGIGWTFTSIIETWILAYGGRSMHIALTEGKLAWNSPEVKAVLGDNLLPLIENGYFSDTDEYETQLKAMWSGKYGFFVGDSTDSQIIDPPTDRGIFLLPGQDTVMLWNDYWFIPKYTKYPEEAKKLLHFLASRGQEIQVSNGGRIATNITIAEDVYPESEKEILTILDKVYVVPDLDDTIGGSFQTEIWSQLALLWSDPNTETLNKVLDRLQKEYENNQK